MARVPCTFPKSQHAKEGSLGKSACGVRPVLNFKGYIRMEQETVAICMSSGHASPAAQAPMGFGASYLRRKTLRRGFRCDNLCAVISKKYIIRSSFQTRWLALRVSIRKRQMETTTCTFTMLIVVCYVARCQMYVYVCVCVCVCACYVCNRWTGHGRRPWQSFFKNSCVLFVFLCRLSSLARLRHSSCVQSLAFSFLISPKWLRP